MILWSASFPQTGCGHIYPTLGVKPLRGVQGCLQASERLMLRVRHDCGSFRAKTLHGWHCAAVGPAVVVVSQKLLGHRPFCGSNAEQPPLMCSLAMSRVPCRSIPWFRLAECPMALCPRPTLQHLVIRVLVGGRARIRTHVASLVPIPCFTVTFPAMMSTVSTACHSFFRHVYTPHLSVYDCGCWGVFSPAIFSAHQWSPSLFFGYHAPPKKFANRWSQIKAASLLRVGSSGA